MCLILISKTAFLTPIIRLESPSSVIQHLLCTDNEPFVLQLISSNPRMSNKPSWINSLRYNTLKLFRGLSGAARDEVPFGTWTRLRGRLQHLLCH